MTKAGAAVLASMALVALECSQALAQEGPASAPAADWISVRDLGAVGDGKADDTAAFEQALERGRKEDRPVYVPRGRYRVTRTLRIEGQLLMGQFAGGWPADSMPMPTLIIDQVTGPGLEMGAFASLHGLALLYPEGTAFPAESAPPAISLAGQGPSITSVRIQYPYDGIITAPGAGPGRARLADIFIVSPRHDGLYLTKSYDVSQLRNVEVWCNVGMSSGAGFRFGRNDDCSCTDLFAFQCQTGFLFETDPEEGGGRFYGSLSNCSTDACSLGYVIRGDHSLNITTSDLVDHHASLDIDGKGASVRLTGCLVQSNGAPAIVVTRCANLLVSTTSFGRAFDSEPYFIEAQSCGSLTITGCQFKPNSRGIYLGEGVERAVVAHNIFEAPLEAITDKMRPEARKDIDGNVAAQPQGR